MTTTTNLEQPEKAVLDELDRIALFINWLQTDGMEYMFVQLMQGRGSGENAILVLDDILRNSIDAGFLKNQPITKVLKADDLETLAHYAISFKAAAKLARELNQQDPALFPEEAIPSDACLNALLALLRHFKFQQTPPPAKPSPTLFARAS